MGKEEEWQKEKQEGPFPIQKLPNRSLHYFILLIAPDTGKGKRVKYGILGLRQAG